MQVMETFKKKGPLGVPMGIWAGGAVVLLYLLYAWRKNRTAKAASTAAPVTGGGSATPIDLTVLPPPNHPPKKKRHKKHRKPRNAPRRHVLPHDSAQRTVHKSRGTTSPHNKPSESEKRRYRTQREQGVRLQRQVRDRQEKRHTEPHRVPVGTKGRVGLPGAIEPSKEERGHTLQPKSPPHKPGHSKRR